MERKEAVEFMQKEAKRLREEEHIDDLFKAKRSEELAAVECKATKAFTEFLDLAEIKLKDDEIAEGDCAATALFATTSFVNNENLFENKTSFAKRLVKELGDNGKSIAAQMLDGKQLYSILSKDFFSDEYLKKYDEVYAIES